MACELGLTGGGKRKGSLGRQQHGVDVWTTGLCGKGWGLQHLGKERYAVGEQGLGTSAQAFDSVLNVGKNPQGF